LWSTLLDCTALFGTGGASRLVRYKEDDGFDDELARDCFRLAATRSRSAVGISINGAGLRLDEEEVDLLVPPVTLDMNPLRPLLFVVATVSSEATLAGGLDGGAGGGGVELRKSASS
jgi:hypothetical protein